LVYSDINFERYLLGGSLLDGASLNTYYYRYKYGSASLNLFNSNTFSFFGDSSGNGFNGNGGNGAWGNGSSSITISAVPEPGAIAFGFLAAASLLGLITRKKWSK